MNDEEKLDELWRLLVSIEARLALLKDMLETKEKIEKLMNDGAK